MYLLAVHTYRWNIYILATNILNINFHFIIVSKIKYYRINLIKEVQDIYLENDKTLLREDKEDLKKWKDTPCSWFRRVNIMMTIIPKIAYKFNVYLSNYINIDKLTLKLALKYKEPKIANIVFNKQNKVKKLVIFCFKAYYKATVIKHWHIRIIIEIYSGYKSFN